jgi:hypothetical protein
MEAIGVVLLAAQLGVTPTAADAAALQYAGDPLGALRVAEQLVLARPNDVTARLLGTCAAIEAGRLRSANELLAPLERQTPPPPRAAVLRALLERRIRAPAEPLMRALAVAWNGVGRPDLASDEPLLDAAGQAPAPYVPHARSPAERILFEMPDATDKPAAAVLAASEELSGAPVVAALQILGALAFLECPADATQRNAAAVRAVEAARRGLPRNGYIEVAALLARCPRRLDAVDVARLEDASARPEFAYPRQEAFDQLLRLAQRIDGPNARRTAISAWLALDVAGMQLRTMLEGVTDPELRRRAARAVERIGWRLADGTAWLERLMGLSLAQAAGRIAQDDPRPASFWARSEAQRDLYRAWSGPKNRLGRWPFAAEWREWTPDEVRASADFLQTIGERPVGPRP